jgi:nitronate monooxygenase
MEGGSRLLRRLGVTHPIIQAPMAGGATTPALVAAVCEAGALGFLAGAYQTPAQILDASRLVRARTSRPFGINLFAPLPTAVPADPGPALRRLAPYHAELGLPAPQLSPPAGDPFDELFAVALESGASVFSFTFGIVPDAALDDARARGMVVIGTATTVDEAVRLEAAGVDAVVAQGGEAGAHRGTFAADFAAAMIGTIALVPQVVDAVRVPVIASGGIMDGRGLVAALALGADAVQLGTAFLTCDEAGVPEAYKEAVLSAREDQTRVTRAFSGRPARGIVNRFMLDVDDLGHEGDAAILPYPMQNSLTRPLRAAAAQQGRAELLSLWAGQGVRLARRQSAGALVARLAAESAAVAGRLGAGGSTTAHPV